MGCYLIFLMNEYARQFFSVLHVFSLFVLAAHTFMAFANPLPENRRRTMMITGIASLLALVSAGALMARSYSWGAPWVIVKLVCWLLLSGLAGMAYRRPENRGMLAVVAFALIVTALLMVYVVRFR